MCIACLLGVPTPGAARAEADPAESHDLRTRYPIVLSHHWSGTADTAFLGDEWDGESFNTGGVKEALEARGAVVYLPDKVPFASHEDRGRLLYRRCEGDTLPEKLCEGEDAVTVDGVEWILLDYCGDADKRHPEYADFGDCIERVKINIICHSQGCPDSRYMIAAVTNRLSGRSMHEHVASWTSMAGANKGTALADWLLSLLGDRPPEGGATTPRGAGLLGYELEDGLTREVYDSVVALTRKYMTRTTDMDCNPRWSDCPPSFNQLYPNHPDVYYQTYSARVRRLHASHAELGFLWAFLWVFEGPNDAYISLDSQRFTTAGPGRDQPPTFVVDRGVITGESTRWWASHPGIAHMGFSTSRVAGLGPDAEHYQYSRVGMYEEIVADLKAMGY